MADTKHGYLVITDISGYTSYLASVELEHAQEILTDLLEIIVDNFKKMMTISKLEGDAIFANIDEENLARPESLLELIEDTYFAFRRRRESSKRSTTCTCKACQGMPALELKFFVHYGDYMLQNISGIRELLGSDVNLVHRLTKNHISENTGWKAYALFTETALQYINLQLPGLHQQEETYEHLGTVQTRTFDLLPRYQAFVAAQRVLLSAEESDVVTRYEFDHPLPIVWDWMMDIAKRNEAMGEMGQWNVVSRTQGRTGIGSSNHCAHGRGSSVETIMDWRPFEYTTVDSTDGKMQFRESMLFTSLAKNATRVEARIKLLKPAPLFISRFMMKKQFNAENPYKKWFERVHSLLSAQPK